MTPAWQRCERCKKIRSGTEFDDGSLVCAQCRAAAERPRPSPVRVTRPATAPRSSGGVGGVTSSALASAAPRPTPEGPLVALGARGRGDREVRVRRARLRALEALAATHPEEFEQLLATERAAENL